MELWTRTRICTYSWEVTTAIIECLSYGELKDVSDPNAFYEANLLMLDISKAKFQLGWEPRTNIEQCCQLTAEWYKRYQKDDVYHLCVEQINTFLS